MVRENISEENYPPWFDVQDNLFPRSRQVFLYEKLMKKLGMMQHVIRDRDFLFFITMYVFILLVRSADNFILFYVHQTLAQNIGAGILIIKQSSYLRCPPGVGVDFASSPS